MSKTKITSAPNPAPVPHRLWTQEETSRFLKVSVRYLRDSGCPTIALPGNGKRGQPVVRYDPQEVVAWARRWRRNNGGQN
jgi:hypothetical protein